MKIRASLCWILSYLTVFSLSFVRTFFIASILPSLEFIAISTFLVVPIPWASLIVISIRGGVFSIVSPFPVVAPLSVPSFIIASALVTPPFSVASVALVRVASLLVLEVLVVAFRPSLFHNFALNLLVAALSCSYLSPTFLHFNFLNWRSFLLHLLPLLRSPISSDCRRSSELFQDCLGDWLNWFLLLSLKALLLLNQEQLILGMQHFELVRAFVLSPALRM